MQELDRAVEEALSCPCVADLKDGPCGKSFVAAFGCFIRSTADEKVRAPAAADGRACGPLCADGKCVRRARTAWRRLRRCSSAC